MQVLATALEFFADTFLGSIRWDFSTFGTYLPFFGNVLEFFKVLGAGWLSFVGLLFILKCFGLAAGLQIERSRVWQFIVRYIFYGFLAIKSWGLMSFVYLQMVGIIEEILDIDASSGGLSLVEFIVQIGERAAEGLLIGALGTGGSMLGIVKVLVLLVITVMLVINFFKLISMFFIRYIRLVLLVALAPIAFGMAILEETKQIFDTYIRTFFADMFVFIMTAFFIQGFINIMSTSTNLNLDGSVEFEDLFADAAYNELVWAFFALAYSSFAVQFDQFIGSLGMNISRGGGAGGGLFGAVGASAIMLRRALGRGTSGAGLSVPLGGTFSRNWNDLKGAVLGGARGGFAQGSTKSSAFARGGMGAAQGFASTTNVAKAAAMTKDGSSFAEALNQKFDKRFTEMQGAASRNMSQQEYDDTKQRAEKNGFSIDQQRTRDAIMNDMKAGNITPAMAQSKLAAQGLLREDEQGAMAMDASTGQPYNQYQGQPNTSKDDIPAGNSMAEEYKNSHRTADGGFDASAPAQTAVSMPEGTTLNPNESLHTSDGTTITAGYKQFPDGTKIYPDGTVQFANGAIMGANVKDANGNALPANAMLHKDGTITNGAEIISPDGNVTKVGDTPVKLDDGTIVQANGVRAIGEGENQVIIGSKGSITHGNSAVTKNATTEHDSGAITKGNVTQHENGNHTFSDGAILLDDGKMAHLNGEVTSPDGTTVTPDGTTIFQDGSILHSNGDITVNGVTSHKDGSKTYGNRVEHGNGTITYNDGHVAYPEGTMVDGKGGVSFDNGNTYQQIRDLPGGQYTHPATGDIAYSNGSVYHASSGAISNADGFIGRVNHADGSGDKDGTFSMGGTVYWGNGTAANPDKTVEFDEHNSGIVVKERTIIHHSGTRTETKNGETKIIREDGYTTFPKKEGNKNTKFKGFGLGSKKRK